MGKCLAKLLPIIVNNPDLHAKWLNTLSFLEYIGFRKIVKSQIAEQLDLETLGHAVEEGRHALLLKKRAVKTGGLNFKTYSAESLLCGTAAEAYFQSLDRACSDQLGVDMAPEKSTRLTYLYVTWLVELRALSVYGLYQEALAATGASPPLNGLLAEEDQHLTSVAQELLKSDIHFSARANDLKTIEETLYQNLISVLWQELMISEGSVAASL